MSGGSDHAPTFGASELLELMEHRLGGGAFGTVYSLRDHPSLAVKEIRLDGLDDRLARNAELELAALARLSHPGILRCHQIIEDKDGDLIHIVMDRHDTSLETLIMKHRRQREPVSAETIVALAAQITGTLAYLHGVHEVDTSGDLYQGIVYRDLKPANILVSEDGNRLVLADFGLCKSAMTSSATRAGSPAYMAPETLLYNSTSPASDIWSLGVIIYELAALKRPNFLSDKEPRHVFTSGWRPDLSPVKDEFIREILEKIFILDPAKRPKAKELASLLQTFDISGDKQQVQDTALEDRCMSLEGALKDANARIATLERELQTNSFEISSLESTIATQAAEMDDFRKKLEMKSNQIDAQSSKIHTLEGQCKEHLAVMKALENKIALLTTSNPQFELLLLPRLMRAAHTNSIETVRMLVEGGDGIGKRDEQGRTALM
ncbi:Serine/threonine protein kinase [Giardia duodenalis]|uniref:non-specific serine/threonine protein kinase n=1 Tax=Giardia intestinalis TaxID=5741 RepID=V6TNF4_GIAIN|nr:Serine/threonine protein kinase [Giardia intestinalis]